MMMSHIVLVKGLKENELGMWYASLNVMGAGIITGTYNISSLCLKMMRVVQCQVRLVLF